MGLIFSLFDVTSAREVPIATSLYMQCILHGLASALLLSHLSLLSTESVDFVVGK